jgi:hypothetical protein
MVSTQYKNSELADVQQEIVNHTLILYLVNFGTQYDSTLDLVFCWI